jgi:hypothetical protein
VTEASVLAQYKLEELEAMPISLTNPPDNPNCPTIINPTLVPTPTVATQDATPVDALGRPIPPATGPAYTYTRTWAWCKSLDGLRRVVFVVVQWSDNISVVSGRPHQVNVRRERVP